MMILGLRCTVGLWAARRLKERTPSTRVSPFDELPSRGEAQSSFCLGLQHRKVHWPDYRYLYLLSHQPQLFLLDC